MRTVFHGPLPDGDTGSRITVWAMAEMAARFWPQVSDLGRGLTAGLDRLDLAERIRAWVEDRIKYVLDPPNDETVRTAAVTLELGFGDCDDQSVLVASLLLAAGVAAEDLAFVLVATEKSGNFSHVVTAIRLEGRGWTVLETIGRATLGRSFSAGEIPAEFQRVEVHPLKERDMSCACMNRGLAGLGTLSIDARVRIAAALKVYAFNKSSRNLRLLEGTLAEYGIGGVSGLGSLSAALQAATPVLSLIPGGGLVASALGPIASAFGGSGDGPSAADLLSQDCQRWLNDPVLSVAYLPDALKNYTECKNKADAGKVARCANVAKCVSQVMAAMRDSGMEQRLTGKIAYSDSQGEVREATWHPIEVEAAEPVSTQTAAPSDQGQASDYQDASDQQSSGGSRSSQGAKKTDSSGWKILGLTVLGVAGVGGAYLATKGK